MDLARRAGDRFLATLQNQLPAADYVLFRGDEEEWGEGRAPPAPTTGSRGGHVRDSMRRRVVRVLVVENLRRALDRTGREPGSALKPALRPLLLPLCEFALLLLMAERRWHVRMHDNPGDTAALVEALVRVALHRAPLPYAVPQPMLGANHAPRAAVCFPSAGTPEAAGRSPTARAGA